MTLKLLTINLEVDRKELHDEAGLLLDIFVDFLIFRHSQMPPDELDHHLVVQIDHDLRARLRVHAHDLAGQGILQSGREIRKCKYQYCIKVSF